MKEMNELQLEEQKVESRKLYRERNKSEQRLFARPCRVRERWGNRMVTTR